MERFKRRIAGRSAMAGNCRRGRRVARFALPACLALAMPLAMSLAMSGGVALAQIRDPRRMASGPMEPINGTSSWTLICGSRRPARALPPGVTARSAAAPPRRSPPSPTCSRRCMARSWAPRSPDTGRSPAKWTSSGSTAPRARPWPGPGGNFGHLSLSASYVRVAPGFGYQVYNGALAGLPLTVDARVGFACFSWSAKATSLLDPVGVSPGGSFVQPWLGFRASLYPAERWRVELAALGQGFGVSGGSWGWGIIPDRNLFGQFLVRREPRVPGTEQHAIRIRTGPLDKGQRSFNFTAYGPRWGRFPVLKRPRAAAPRSADRPAGSRGKTAWNPYGAQAGSPAFRSSR